MYFTPHPIFNVILFVFNLGLPHICASLFVYSFLHAASPFLCVGVGIHMEVMATGTADGIVGFMQ